MQKKAVDKAGQKIAKVKTGEKKRRIEEKAAEHAR